MFAPPFGVVFVEFATRTALSLLRRRENVVCCDFPDGLCLQLMTYLDVMALERRHYRSPPFLDVWGSLAISSKSSHAVTSNVK